VVLHETAQVLDALDCGVDWMLFKPVFETGDDVTTD
jgi:hypothetical protein